MTYIQLDHLLLPVVLLAGIETAIIQVPYMCYQAQIWYVDLDGQQGQTEIAETPPLFLPIGWALNIHNSCSQSPITPKFGMWIFLSSAAASIHDNVCVYVSVEMITIEQASPGSCV